MTAPVPPNARPPKILTVTLNEAGFGTTAINGQRIPGVIGLQITSRPRELTRVTLELLGYEINGEIATADLNGLDEPGHVEDDDHDSNLVVTWDGETGERVEHRV